MDTENYHEGHRQRLKNQFFRTRGIGMPDHQILEILLMYAIPRKDVNVLAHKLIKRFGSLPNLFNASREDLLMVDGVGQNTATMLMAIFSFADRASLRTSFPSDTIRFKTPKQVGAYALHLCRSEHLENAYLICVNSRMEVIMSDIISLGNTASVTFNPRRIFEMAFAYHASGIFLAHNHPTGYVIPSPEDEDLALQLLVLGQDLNVRVHDNLVVGYQAVCSLSSQNVFLYKGYEITETMTLETYKNRFDEYQRHTVNKLS